MSNLDTGVTVVRDDGATVKHLTATNFESDPAGNLLVANADGLIAIYGPGRWAHAVSVKGGPHDV